MNTHIHRHARSFVFVLAVLGLAGIGALSSMPVGLFPRITFPRVSISLEAGDRPAERMEIEVTVPVEDAVRAIPGTRHVRSTSSRGAADISMDFDWGTDMVAATLMVESAVNSTMSQLPAGTKFEVRRMDTTTFPVVAYSLTSDSISLVDLRDIAQFQIRPVLSTIPGVAQVKIMGGKTREFQVIIDPVKARSLDVSIDAISAALSTSNTVAAVGRMEDLGHLYLVLSDTSFSNLQQIQATVIKTGSGAIIRLEDIATVQQGTEPQWVRATADGRDAVLFQIYQQLNGDTLAISARAGEEIDKLRGRLPKGVKIAQWYDQSELIRASALSVRDALAIGVVLAFLVLLGFLKSFRISAIALLTVPLTLAITSLFLSLFGLTLNIMSLGGMAAAVGLIIDDGLVMIEHMARRWSRLQGDPTHKAALAARELLRPLAGSSAATVVIFAPLAFLSGVTGAFFRVLSVTLAVALIVSFLIAWLLVPLIGAWLFAHPSTESQLAEQNHQSTGFFAVMSTRFLRHPWISLAVLLPLAAFSYFAYTQVGSGFMPAVDEGGFVLDYRAPSGTSLQETDRRLRQVERILTATPEVSTYSRRTGLALGGTLTESNEGDFFVRLTPLPRRDIETVMDYVRKRIDAQVPGLEVEMALLMEDLIGDLTAVPQPIEVKIFGDDNSLLQSSAKKVAARIAKVQGVVDVKSGIVLAGDGIDIIVDRDLASLEGLSASDVTDQLDAQISGRMTTRIQSGVKMIGLRVWTAKDLRSTQKKLGQLSLRAPDGHWLPLSRVARIKTATGQPQLVREDFKRMVAVTGRISGRDMGSTMHEILQILDGENLLAKGIYYRVGGLYSQQRKAFVGLMRVFAAAVALVFALLLFLYESFKRALIMMFPALFGAGAAFIGLWLTGIELNITAMMGITMVIGIVTEVSIFYVSEFTDLHDISLDQRLVDAVSQRVRPIAMTTLAAIFALSPLALSIGEGAALLQPLAITIIAGLIVQMPLVLWILPVLIKLTGLVHVDQALAQKEEKALSGD